MARGLALRLAAAALVSSAVYAHDHHGDNIPEGEVISPDPIDGILWWHISAMIISFGLLFPIGMVLGIVRSRWHVPLQVFASVIAVTGWFLGHAHKGRQFAPNIHSSFASTLMSFLLLQVCMGVYLKLHLEKGIHGKIRKWVVRAHGVVGVAMPILSWVQMLFGGITALGFCRADHQGQCLAHFIMGSSFIAYGTIMVIMILVGQAWLKRTGKSQEFWDSSVITAWGIVNTFTEHRWGQTWAGNDLQHTSMGIVWWCAGLLGVWLSRGKSGAPRRNLIPAIVIFLTGYAMSSHPQHLPLSTMVHTIFGYTLMGAGLTRMIEVSFVLKDKPTPGEPSSFQHLPPYLLYAAGFIFMCATEEQLALVDSIGIDHVSYTLILYSLAFLLYLFTQLLIHIYQINQAEQIEYKKANGVASEEANGRVRDVEEFELEGLISDGESADDGNKRHT